MDEQILQAIDEIQKELRMAKYNHILDYECYKCGKTNSEAVYIDGFLDISSLEYNLNLIIDKIKLIMEREAIQKNLF